jgi:tetratricopeptide (TPR) repeat protein
MREDGLKAIWRRDWASGIALWRRQIDAAPDHPEAYALLVLCLRESGQLDEADRLGDEAIPRFPKFARLRIEHGLISVVRRAWPEARIRFEAIRAAFPKEPEGYVRGAAIALELGQRDERESILCAGVSRCPSNKDLVRTYADMAANAQDWQHALFRFGLFRARFPEDAAGYAGQAVAYEHLDMPIDAICAGSAAPGVTSPADPDTAAPPDYAEWIQAGATPRDILMRFESLGASQALASAQTDLGVHAHTLYRRNRAPLSRIVNGLAGGLEGIGKPENTALYCRPGGLYTIADKRGHVIAETPFRDGAVTHEILFPLFCATLAYQREALLAALRTPRKIFAYASRAGSLPDDDIRTLSAALGAHGPAVLLCVRPAERPGPARVEAWSETLLVGSLAIAPERPDQAESWVELGRLALDTLSTSRPH